VLKYLYGLLCHFVCTQTSAQPTFCYAGTQFLLQKSNKGPSQFLTMCILTKWLDRQRWHLACRWTWVQHTFCYMEIDVPSPKTNHNQFLVHLYYGQMARCVKMPLGMQISLASSDTVRLWLNSRTLPKKHSTTLHKFSAHVYCSQKPVCISILLGTKVELYLDDTVLNGNLVPHPLQMHSLYLFAHVSCDQRTAHY